MLVGPQNPRVGGRSTAPSVGLRSTECHNVLPRAKLELIVVSVGPSGLML